MTAAIPVLVGMGLTWPVCLPASQRRWAGRRSQLRCHDAAFALTSSLGTIPRRKLKSLWQKSQQHPGKNGVQRWGWTTSRDASARGGQLQATQSIL